MPDGAGPEPCRQGRQGRRVVRKFKHAINTARSICGTAFGIEHHAHTGHRRQGAADAALRVEPVHEVAGFGYGLKPTEEEDVYDPIPSVAPGPEQGVARAAALGQANTFEFPLGRG